MQPSKGLHNQVVKIVVPYCAGTTGVASLALTASGCELPLCEPWLQALFSAIFSSVGPFYCSSEKVSLNPSEFTVALSSLPTLSPLFPR